MSEYRESVVFPQLTGKVIRSVYRGTDGFSDLTIFIKFEDGTSLHIGHNPEQQFIWYEGSK